MHKWRVSFGGARHEDVETFIMRVDEGLEMVRVRDEDLLRALPFSLSGAALTWYRGRLQNFHTWVDVKQTMRYRFADPDNQMAFREEISNQPEARDELISHYIACMNGLFSRTDPP
ncbi:activity-regulated cytoskeleton associated protein 2-like [Cotesia typhae]|uniref:activity-regulated cytoskeleton associated protein 2-like n=1 Tax=Cotesia typhae TaxID=2053667 RepID=UPI003D680335